ncbi:membrane-spanning 4-domains subfamily A member 8-like [Sphaerodactylus townsendi]|uniref:membrane-spanning 4-domains subfamily A member 8-like n=1 Tax=Sphaerodactylus townsendi TaxID=933632 RepID=UPI002026A22C|nr:membrane-spanning 4-domains subfamily A member 8-like [Sphaerodactylus townsendi]
MAHAREAKEVENPQVGVLEKMLKVEAKTLGVTQIMIGLIHIGFGAVPLVLFGNYFPLTSFLGYPFWGGGCALWEFIASGSLSVSIENHLNRCLVQSSVGMNITSAVMALTGVSLYISELILNRSFFFFLKVSNSVGPSVLLLLFSLLEFCITVSTAHFGCQAVCCNSVPNLCFWLCAYDFDILVEGHIFKLEIHFYL